MIDYITFALAITFISWIVGMLFNALLMKTEYHKKLTDLNFIESKRLNKTIGLEYFKWIVRNTFFKFFNQKITLKNKKTELAEVRNEMTTAELGHLIGFVFVTFFACYKTVSHDLGFGLTIMAVNILMNLYPSLLQQENKRRIDRLIALRSRTSAAAQ